MIGLNDPQENAKFAKKMIGEAVYEITAGRFDEQTRQQWRDDVTKFDNPDRRARCRKHPRTADKTGACFCCKNGPVLGNCSFAYIIPQMVSLENTPKINFDEQQIPMQHLPMYYNNLRWLAQPRNEKLVDVIMALGYSSNKENEGPMDPPMISWDSTKFLINPNVGTPKNLTKQHFDKYVEGNHRRQMIVEFSQRSEKNGRARQLAYLPFSNRKEVQDLIAKILKKPKLYDNMGFVGLGKNKRLKEIINKRSISFNGPHLAAWQGGVIHFEGYFVPSEKDNRLCVYKDSRMTSENLELIRLVVGTHLSNFNKEERSLFAAWAKKGFLPSVYHSKKYQHTKIGANMVAAKTTQNKYYRVPQEPEKKKFAEAKAKIEDQEGFLEELADISPNILPLLGLKHKDTFGVRK